MTDSQVASFTGKTESMKSQALLFGAREWIEAARTLEGTLESECMRIEATGDVRKETKTNKLTREISGSSASMARTTC
jgi:hypothetical protein